MNEVIDVVVLGIPAKARIAYYQPAERGICVSGMAWTNPAPPTKEDVEYELLDRKGYRAAWLEAKIDGKGSAAWHALNQNVLEALHEQRQYDAA